MGNGDQTLSVDRQQARADQIVGMARRHAEEIRAAAEEEAERVLLEAERESSRRQEERLRHAEEVRAAAEQEAKRLLLEAEREGARRWEERLEAERRERARFAINRSQIEDALDATVAAVTRVRELIASFPASESPAPAAAKEAPIRPAAVASTQKVSSSRHRAMNIIAVVLGGWAVMMIALLLVLSQKPAAADKASISAPQAQLSADASSTAARPERVAASPTPPAEDPGLTVAFVAARDCWISLGVDDGTPSDRLLKASEKYVVRARDVVSFKAGNAGALSLLINDRPAGPLGAEGQVVSRRVTRANYRSFLQS